MPIQKKQVDGKWWYRWGDEGKWYDNLQDALKQMRAIKASQAKRKK